MEVERATTAPPRAPIAALPDERIRFQHPELPPVEEVLAYFERSREARWFSNGGPCASELTARLGRWPTCLPA